MALLKLTILLIKPKIIMKKRYLILLTAIASLQGYSQTPAPATPVANDYGISWYGFLRTDYIWDTRKSASVREDQLNLYPLDKSINAGDGNDANAVGQSNFLSVVSRLGVKVKGPDVWGAKVSGTLEADFFGNFEVPFKSIEKLIVPSAAEIEINNRARSAKLRIAEKK